MRLSVPPVKGIDVKHRSGFISQLIVPARDFEGHWARFVLPSATGGRLVTTDGDVIYAFPKPPKLDQLPTDGPVLVGPVPDGEMDHLDLSAGKWLVHSAMDVSHTGSMRARESWLNGFRYIGEDEAGEGRIGLRRPQLGALHAIHAHWSTSRDVATVVMPTGTGKTETMLATLVSARCTRVLVLVPTDALRAQIAQKFLSLGILKDSRAELLQPGVIRPVVGILTRKPTTPEEADDFFRQCNVVVTTSALAGGCTLEVQERMAEQCTHLFIDEAHHAEAATWKRFKSYFKSQKQILQFTATPFREDEVCGQAQRSVLWLHNKSRQTDLFGHLLKREALRVESGRSTRFEIGAKERLIQIRDLSRTCRVAIHVFIVQPGLSKVEAADHQLALLGVTEKFLQETYQVPLRVYCSNGASTLIK